MRGTVPEHSNNEKETGQSKNLNPNPHRLAIAFIDAIIPQRHREAVQDQLLDRHPSSCAYVGWGILYLAFIMARQLWPSFKPLLWATELLVLSAAFAANPWGQPSWIAVAAGMAGLTLCDAYRHPDARGLFYKGWDTVAAMALVMVVEMYERVVAPDMALSQMTLARGVAVSLLTLPMVRILFHVRPSQDPFGTAAPWMTYLMTGMWMAAAMTLHQTYLALNPKLFFYLDTPLTIVTVQSFSIAFRLQKNQLERTFGRNDGKILFTDKILQQLEEQYYWIWTPPETKPGEFPWPTFLEIAGFMFLSFPMALVFAAWALGYLAFDEMDWLAWITNTLAMAALAALWPLIRIANHNLAKTIRTKWRERKGLVL